MQLDENQKKTVVGWVEEGLDLSAIQSRLESEMDVRMTYMDVRFLVGDLELTPKDEEPEPEETESEEDCEIEDIPRQLELLDPSSFEESDPCDEPGAKESDEETEGAV